MTRRLTVLLLGALALLLAVPAGAGAGAAPSAAPRDNPLAGREWGTYRGPAEMAWQPYVDARGPQKRTLARIAHTPKAKWFGAWIPDREIAGKVREYVENAQGGDPSVLVQMSVFRMVPWEHEACSRLPTEREQASYRTWIDSFARALGDTPAAVVLQPDLPFALCVPRGSDVPTRLVAYAAKKLSDLPRTSVYLDAGAADWPAEGQGGVRRALDFLVPAGIRHVRGVALNATHYSATALEVRRAAALVEALADRGITGKHAVINTSSNGQPFRFGEYDGPDPDNARTCRSRHDDRRCVALGIPPTHRVAADRWRLPAEVDRLARRYVDAYLWVGRPWLYRQNSPFQMKRALAVVRSSPWR